MFTFMAIPGMANHRCRVSSYSTPARMDPSFYKTAGFCFSTQANDRKESFDVILGFGNTVAMNVYQSHGGVHHISNKRKLQAVSNPLLRFLKKLILFVTP